MPFSSAAICFMLLRQCRVLVLHNSCFFSHPSACHAKKFSLKALFFDKNHICLVVSYQASRSYRITPIQGTIIAIHLNNHAILFVFCVNGHARLQIQRGAIRGIGDGCGI